MNEPLATNTGQAGGAPGAGDATGGGAGDATGGGGVPADLTSQQMIDKLGGMLGADAEGIQENERFQLQQQARNQIGDTKEIFKEYLPDATNGQTMDFIEGMMGNDTEMVIKAVMAAVKVMQEKEEQDAKTGAGDLNVQTGGSGKGAGGTQQASKSMNESVLRAADLFKN